MGEIMRGEATAAQIAGSSSRCGSRARRWTRSPAAPRRCASTSSGHPRAPTSWTWSARAATGRNTYNISTAAALVAAAAGAAVAKHGNRAASSQTGAADVLEALGFELELPPERIERSIDELGFGFLFAQAHHPAMRHAAPVRRELATRTVFNVLGPLTNPAGARALVLGVYSPELARTLADALVQLETTRLRRARRRRHRRALAVRAESRLRGDGGTGARVRARPARARHRTLRPGRAARRRPGRRTRPRCGTCFAGADGGHRSAVILNAAGGIAAAGHAETSATGSRCAREAIDSGAAAARLDELVEFSRSS